MARQPMPMPMDAPMDMPNMDGANMNAGNPMPAMPPEEMDRLLQPSEEIAMTLDGRLATMSEQEIAMLDQIITPEAAQVLMKLLPELGDLFASIAEQNMMMQEDAMMPPGPAGPPMGALGGMG